MFYMCVHPCVFFWRTENHQTWVEIRTWSLLLSSSLSCVPTHQIYSGGHDLLWSTPSHCLRQIFLWRRLRSLLQMLKKKTPNLSLDQPTCKLLYSSGCFVCPCRDDVPSEELLPGWGGAVGSPVQSHDVTGGGLLWCWLRSFSSHIWGIWRREKLKGLMSHMCLIWRPCCVMSHCACKLKVQCVTFFKDAHLSAFGI